MHKSIFVYSEHFKYWIQSSGHLYSHSTGKCYATFPKIKTKRKHEMRPQRLLCSWTERIWGTWLDQEIESKGRLLGRLKQELWRAQAKRSKTDVEVTGYCMMDIESKDSGIMSHISTVTLPTMLPEGDLWWWWNRRWLTNRVSQDILWTVITSTRHT